MDFGNYPNIKALARQHEEAEELAERERVFYGFQGMVKDRNSEPCSDQGSSP